MALKPLDDALRDGDTIRAVVRGSGINQDGNTTFFHLILSSIYSLNYVQVKRLGSLYRAPMPKRQ